ncbi:MAG: hypothetical protein PVSMB7_26150 [Chloroflexota bacterium]
MSPIHFGSRPLQDGDAAHVDCAETIAAFDFVDPEAHDPMSVDVTIHEDHTVGLALTLPSYGDMYVLFEPDDLRLLIGALLQAHARVAVNRKV